jgi:hypothetical protein
MELNPVLGKGLRASAWDRIRALIRLPPTPVLLGILVLAITALNVRWRTIESRPPHWEMARHLGDSLVYRHVFSFTHPLPFLDSYHFYPPLVSWVTDVFYAALGSEAMSVAILSNGSRLVSRGK